MSKITFEKVQGSPQAEGTYLYVHGFHPLDKEFVYVYWVEPSKQYGLDFKGYWACHNGRNVANYRGQWYREVNAAASSIQKEAANGDVAACGDYAYRSWDKLP
jgi:hypothetical protein